MNRAILGRAASLFSAVSSSSLISNHSQEWSEKIWRPMPAKPREVVIDRFKPFDCGAFVKPFLDAKVAAPHWRVEEELDSRVRKIRTLDLNRVMLLRCFRPQSDRPWDFGYEALNHLKTLRRTYILLDAKIFEVAFRNPDRVPADWFENLGGFERRILFPGTVVHDPTWQPYLLELWNPAKARPRLPVSSLNSSNCHPQWYAVVEA